MEMLKKVLPFEVKEVAPRVLEFIGSTEDKDRQGDIIMAGGWQLKHYKKNPVFMWAHQYADPPIGKAIKVWAEDGKLKFHIQFAEKDEYEFADTIYKLYKGGYLRASSVGFMPLESEPIDKDDEGFFAVPTRFLKQELLELSGCPVPANPNALAEAKAKGLIKDLTKFMVEDPAVLSIEIEGDPEKPYPNEHACRLRNPDDFRDGSFRRVEREHNGKKYSVIRGILKEGEEKWEDQALRYKKEVWTAAEASKHCKDHDGTFEPASEQSDNFQVDWSAFRAAISYQSAHPDGTPKAGDDVEWDAGKEVAAAEIDDLKVMCAIVQGDPDLKTSYKLPHHQASGKHPVVWAGVAAAGAALMGARGGIDATAAEKTGAKAHLAKHYEEFDKEPPWKAAESIITQASIADELEYLGVAIESEGLNEENMVRAWELVRTIFGCQEVREPGSDIPVDITDKVGAVLNKTNRERLEKIKTLAQEVLDSAEKEDEPDKSHGVDREEIEDIVTSSVTAVIEKARGKI